MKGKRNVKAIKWWHSHVILKKFFLYYESNMIMILKNAIYEKIYIGILTMIKTDFVMLYLFYKCNDKLKDDKYKR